MINFQIMPAAIFQTKGAGVRVAVLLRRLPSQIHNLV
jgi:hypothetical protein